MELREHGQVHRRETGRPGRGRVGRLVGLVLMACLAVGAFGQKPAGLTERIAREHGIETLLPVDAKKVARPKARPGKATGRRSANPEEDNCLVKTLYLYPGHVLKVEVTFDAAWEQNAIVKVDGSKYWDVTSGQGNRHHMPAHRNSSDRVQKVILIARHKKGKPSRPWECSIGATRHAEGDDKLYKWIVGCEDNWLDPYAPPYDWDDTVIYAERTR